MKGDKNVLVIDPAAGALSGVMEELDELGFRVVWVPTLAAGSEFLKSDPRLSLIVASAAASDEPSLEFLAQVKAQAPELRVIWGVRTGATSPPASARRSPGPDSIIPEPFAPDDLRRAVAELLAEHFYPTAIAEAVKSSALEVLRKARPFEVVGGAFLVENRSALSDLSAVISFSGGVSGHLMVGTTRSDAQFLHRALLPHVRAIRMDALEDLIGELCNQILGRINAFFVARGLSIQHATPIFIRAPGSTLRYPGRQPSFAVGLVDPVERARVDLEYYLADLPRDVLERPPSPHALGLDEIRYL